MKLTLIANLALLASPVLTFVVLYARTGSITTAQAFTSLAIITLLTNPLSVLLSAIPTFASSLGCFDRIQKYLLSLEGADRRTFNSNAESKDIKKSFKSSNQVADPRLFELSTLQPSFKPHKIDRDTMVDLQCCSFGEPPLLQNIDLSLKRSSLTIIIGPVGSGKTVLLKGLLGELPISRGSGYVDTKEIAYCAQTPWLVNATIQRNIRGESVPVEEDIVWYQRVLHACGLDSDLKQLTEGDQLVVGSSGFSLSGGQKQRVVRYLWAAYATRINCRFQALARAIYSRKTLVLLDDVLSGLDNSTRTLIVERLLAPAGLFRQHAITAVLVTHNGKL